jgi:hypothetical protein
MKSINQNTSIGNQPSDNIIYTGQKISCLTENCSNPRLSDIIYALGEKVCYTYNQILSLNTVNTYCKNIGCDAKTFVNLFNSLFQSVCTLENNILNIQIGEKPDVKFLITCPDNPIITPSLENTILINPLLIGENQSYNKECEWQTVNNVWTQITSIPTLQKDFFCFSQTDATCSLCNAISLQDFYIKLVTNIQNLNYETYNIYQEICTLKGQLFNSINNIVIQSGGSIYLDDVTVNPCSVSFLPYEIITGNPALTTSIKPAINLVNSDLCKVKTILGGYSDIVDLWNYTKSLRCKDPDGILPDYTLDNNMYTGIGASAGDVNIIKYIKVLFNSVCNLNNNFNALTNTLNECCKTDCDTCLTYGLTIEQFNYGMFTANPNLIIPGAIIQDNTKPQIAFLENIGICSTDQLDLGLSKYVISDGVNTISYTFQDLITGVPGITLVSGVIGNNATFLLDLQLLGLSYLGNITIRQRLKTIIFKCDSNEKVLIPGFKGRECGKCNVCLISLSDTCDVTVSPIPSVTFVYNGESYYLDLANPCITIPLYNDQYGRPIPIVGINYNCEKLALQSECPELGLLPICPIDDNGGTNSETKCKWFVPISQFHHFGLDLINGAEWRMQITQNISYSINNDTIAVITTPITGSLTGASNDDILDAISIVITNALVSIGGIDNILFNRDARIISFCAPNSYYFYNNCSNVELAVISDDFVEIANTSNDHRLTLKSVYNISNSFQKICDCCTTCS